jgi:hypothetical protein
MNTCCSKRHSIQGILLSVAFVLGSKMINLNNKKNNPIVKATILAGSATIIVLVAAVGATIIEINWSADAFVIPGLGGRTDSKAPAVVSGDNIYIAWWTNNTENGNEEVMFRSSNDAGQTFGDKINLSNTTDADSWRVEIAAEGANVLVTWWETNQTSDTPVARISTDGGETFGPVLRLATNGTTSSTDETTAETTTTTPAAEGGEEGEAE